MLFDLIAVAGAMSLSAQADPVDSDIARAQLDQQIQGFNDAVEVGTATPPRFAGEGQDPYYDEAKVQQHELQRLAHAAALAQAASAPSTVTVARDAGTDAARMALHRAVRAQDERAQRALQLSAVKSAAL